MSCCTVVILKYRGSLVQKSRASKFVKEGGNGVVVMKVGEEFRTVRSHVQICVCTYPHYKLQDVHMNCTCDSCSLQSIEAILSGKNGTKPCSFLEPSSHSFVTSQCCTTSTSACEQSCEVLSGMQTCGYTEDEMIGPLWVNFSMLPMMHKSQVFFEVIEYIDITLVLTRVPILTGHLRAHT